MKRISGLLFLMLLPVIVLASCANLKGAPIATKKPILKITNTPPSASPTASFTPFFTPSPSPFFTPSPTQTVTVFPFTITPTRTVTPVFTVTGGLSPFPNAPICSDSGESHNRNEFHTLWDATHGCHYDHEHGQNPFTSQIANAFPGFDLRELLGGVGVGHTNPSSPMENTHKHGGFKWQTAAVAPNGCTIGFEDGTVAVKSYAIQFHAFGRQDIEHESRNHSSSVMLSFCKPTNPNDVGYMYVVQLQEYGQRVMPYQGMVLNYPDNFMPLYISPRGPYLTNECFGQDSTWVDVNGEIRTVDCRPTFNDLSNNLSVWSSKPTRSNGPSGRPTTPSLFRLLFRGRDMYQRLDVTDLMHPFTWQFVCGGSSYNPVGCRYNSSTFTISEVAGDIPSAWDGLAGFDTDTRVGRITAEGYVTQFGALRQDCTAARSATADDAGCYPIKMIGAFVGRYSSQISIDKVSNPTPINNPERDIYFCNGVFCGETSPGALPSGWIGQEN